MSQRIVSLLPGATEIVAALGLGDQLVGISAECDQPPALMDRPRVSLAALETTESDPAAIDREVRDRLARGAPLFQADPETLRALRPDLILSQSLCDVCAATPASLTAEAIGAATVLALDGRDLSGLLQDIRRVAEAAGVPARGEALIAALDRRRHAIAPATGDRPRVLAVEWPEPLFIGGHWVPDMIVSAGGRPLNAQGDHSVVIDWDAVRAFAPSHILVLPCGQSLAGAEEGLRRLRGRPGWSELPAVLDARVHLLDGNRFFSRPGPAAVTGLEIVAHLLGTGSSADPAPGAWRTATPTEIRPGA
ncbi:ABC transporter substrate-binding protein [Spiribacter sp. 1M153]|uniref:ABC transporter substrate-binding protein n=1 Tax=Spiribacter roseus TaxID=1855875 RepID=UPI00349F8FBB